MNICHYSSSLALWVRAGGCKRKYPKGQSRTCYQECGCNLINNWSAVHSKKHKFMHAEIQSANRLPGVFQDINRIKCFVCRWFLQSVRAVVSSPVLHEREDYRTCNNFECIWTYRYSNNTVSMVLQSTHCYHCNVEVNHAEHNMGIIARQKHFSIMLE